MLMKQFLLMGDFLFELLVNDAINFYFWYYASTMVKDKYFKIMSQALYQGLGLQ